MRDGTNTYLYGNGRISQQALTTEYFLTDALGSVRQLTDIAGMVTLTQSYAPYGETVSSTGSGASVYQFTGESRDANGLTYLRARYYNSGDGRFISRDTWSGDYKRPLSLNRWGYVEGNPVNLVNPTGMKPGDSKYCVPLSGIDRQYCNNIVRGLNPELKLTEAQYRWFDWLTWSNDCDSLPNLDDRLPHSLYRGTYKKFGWWWYFLLDRTPGWWNENGEGHIYFKDVLNFALAAELSTTEENFPEAAGYFAGAFSNKGRSEGFYYMIGSRQSVFMRVNNAVYGSSHPKPGTDYDFNQFRYKFGKELSDSGTSSRAYRLRGWGHNILANTGFTTKQRLAYEWDNPTDLSPQSLLEALRKGNEGTGSTNVLYLTESLGNVGSFTDGGITIYKLDFVVSKGQLNTLCGGASCVVP